MAAQTSLILADGSCIGPGLLAPSVDGGGPRTLRAFCSRAGERFLLTRELEVLVEVLEDGPTQDIAARRFGAAFGSGVDFEAFDRWVLLLAQQGIVEWRSAPAVDRAEATMS
jgi:hypothetical protein